MTPGFPDRTGLRRQAMDCLQAAVRYPANPAVRVAAVEALQADGSETARPWIREAMNDEHPAARFAACVAVGVLRDDVSLAAVHRRVEDRDPSVRVGALFACHRLGDASRTGRMPAYLLEHPDAAVRRNAALVLGLMNERGVIPLLARAMRDRDMGVRHHALEAMARLGNREAAQELAFLSSTGIGSEEVFALNALAILRDRTYEDTFRYKLNTAAHLETRLASARGLGLLGADDGFDLARRMLWRTRPALDDPADPPADQVLRIRQLAAAALGAIGRTEALPALKRAMEDPSDPRIQVSAARAVLEILRADRDRGLPFATGRGG